MDAPGRPTLVTASAVVSAVPAVLSAVVVGVLAASQTIKLHNCKTTGAASGGNEMVRIATDAVGDFDFGPLGAYFDTGIVAIVSGGTPVATVVAG
jgi:hypothetical protein